MGATTLNHPAPCQLREAPYCRDEDKIVVVELSNKSRPDGSELWFSCPGCATYLAARYGWAHRGGLVKDMESDWVRRA